MRRLSQLFAVLVVATPPAVYLLIGYAASRFEREHGFPPEGKGYFDFIVLGLRVMLVCALLACATATLAWLRAPDRQTWPRRLELGVAVALAPVVVLLTKNFIGTWPATLLLLTGL